MRDDMRSAVVRAAKARLALLWRALAAAGRGRPLAQQEAVDLVLAAASGVLRVARTSLSVAVVPSAAVATVRMAAAITGVPMSSVELLRDDVARWAKGPSAWGQNNKQLPDASLARGKSMFLITKQERGEGHTILCGAFSILQWESHTRRDVCFSACLRISLIAPSLPSPHDLERTQVAHEVAELLGAPEAAVAVEVSLHARQLQLTMPHGLRACGKSASAARPSHRPVDVAAAEAHEALEEALPAVGVRVVSVSVPEAGKSAGLAAKAPTEVRLSLDPAAASSMDRKARSKMVASVAKQLGVPKADVEVVRGPPAGDGTIELTMRVVQKVPRQLLSDGLQPPVANDHVNVGLEVDVLQSVIEEAKEAVLGALDEVLPPDAGVRVVSSEEAEQLPMLVTLNVADVPSGAFAAASGEQVVAAIAAQLDMPVADVQIAEHTSSTRNGKRNTAVVLRLLAPPAPKGSTSQQQHSKAVAASMCKAVSKQLKVPESKATVESVAKAEAAPTLVTLSVDKAAAAKLDTAARADMVRSVAEEMGVEPEEVQIVQSKPKRNGQVELQMRVVHTPTSGPKRAKATQAREKAALKAQGNQGGASLFDAKMHEAQRHGKQAHTQAEASSRSPPLPLALGPP